MAKWVCPVCGYVYEGENPPENLRHMRVGDLLTMNLGAVHTDAERDDIARFGQFLLQEGRWNDRQLLSREWV